VKTIVILESNFGKSAIAQNWYPEALIRLIGFQFPGFELIDI
jgi:hypothetical protein